MTIKAINKAHQTTVNRAYKALRKYYTLVDLGDTLELYSKALQRIEDKQAAAFDVHECALNDLPAREEVNFNKQHKAIHGYV